MSHPPQTPIATTISGFHDLAAQRGDGLHPLLLQALAKSGSVSGPPVPSEKNDETVVRVDFTARSYLQQPEKTLPR